MGRAGALSQKSTQREPKFYFGSERAMIRKLLLIYPPKLKLETFMNKSLMFEEILMCEKYPELRQAGDPSLSFDEHKRVFWDIFVAKEKTFCSVDTRVLFGNARSLVD